MKELFERYRDKAFIIIYGILSFPVFFSTVKNGLDNSWVYVLNKLVSFENIKFGRDVVFTYGPLGFLSNPQYINRAYIYGSIIYSILFVGQLILIKRVFDATIDRNSWRVVFFIFLIFLSNLCDWADRYIQYCVLIALLTLWMDFTDRLAVSYLIITTIIAIFFKFSIVVPIIAAFVIFAIGKMIKKEIKRLWVLCIPFIASVALYLLYNASIIDFLRYIKGSWEVAKGFNAGMSLNLHDQYVLWMFLFMLLYVILLLIQLKEHNLDNFFLMLIVSPTLYMSYKHGYVRADNGHVMVSFCEILTECALILLFYDTEILMNGIRSRSRQGMFHASVICILVLSVGLNYETSIHPWENLHNRIHGISAFIYQMNSNAYEKQVSDLSSIPESFVDAIGDETFTVFPYEISSIESLGEKSQNYIPLFTLQAYTAYTEYLDIHTAKMLRDNSPNYIIFQFGAIDGRISLLETPATWTMICDYYVPCLYDEMNDMYLFVRKPEGCTPLKSITGNEYRNIFDVIPVSNCDEIVLSSDLSLYGKIVSFIWKIPEVKAKITYSNGEVLDGRVIMDVLSNGIRINSLPYNYDTMYDVFYANGDRSTIEYIELYGDGLKFYNNNLEVKYIQYE